MAEDTRRMQSERVVISEKRRRLNEQCAAYDPCSSTMHMYLSLQLLLRAVS